MTEKFAIVVDRMASRGGLHPRVSFMGRETNPSGQAIRHALVAAEKAYNGDYPPKHTQLGWLYTDAEGSLENVELFDPEAVYE